MRGSKSRWARAIVDGRQWREADARAAIAAWRDSGDSMSAFCRRHGMAAQRLSWWRKRLDVEADVAMAPLLPVTVRPAAIEVVVEDLRVEVAVPEAVAPTWVAELVQKLRSSGG